MICSRCGSVSPENAQVCVACGQPLKLKPEDFSALSKKARAHYREFNSGRLTQEQYNAAIQALTLPDPSGGYWTYQPGARQWLWHDGRQWQRRKPPANAGASKTPVFIGAGIGLLLLIVAGVIFLFSFLRRGGEPIEETASIPVAALMLAIDEQNPAFTAYVGDPSINPLILPAGVYYIEVMLPEGTVVSLGMKEIRDAGGGEGEVQFPANPAEAGERLSSEAAAQFKDLLNFMLLADNARLTYYQIVTSDYAALPYTVQEDVPVNALQPLFEVYAALAAREDEMVEAAQYLQQRALDSASAFSPGLGTGRAGMASPRQWISLLDKLRTFCGLGASAEGRAQQEIIKAFSEMTDVQKQEALELLPEVYGARTDSPDAFIQQVKDGDLQKWVLRIRQDLWQDGYYQGTVQNQSGANRPGLDTARQEGAALVEAGANLYVEVIKTTLTAAFPGIGEGYGYAEKIDKWANYIRDLLNDPEVAIERFTLDQIKDMIKDNIKEGLGEINPGLSDDEIDEAAGVASDHIMEGIKNDLQTRIDDYTASLEKTAQAAASETEESAPEETESPPDYSWIEGYVASLAGELRAAGYEEEKVDALAGELRSCLTRQVKRGRDDFEAKENCANLVDRFIKNPPPTQEVYHFSGIWHSKVLCGEDDDPAYRWNVALSEDTAGWVTGTISFHACPGGGAIYYTVSGQNTGEKKLVLQAERTEWRGELGSSAMRSGQFTIEYMGPPSPNYAP
ncbi:MAG: zinc ribbon domain-containing protein [Anaerolineaceae bacterium]|jgi:ribosomal protein L37E